MSSSPTVTPFPLGDAFQREGLSVFVRGLRLDVGIGVYDHEQGRLQTLVIDVTLEMGPVVVEHLADTINYETVAAAARAIAAAGHVGLVETFAERLAVACLEDARVRRVAVRIEKPGALDGAEAAGCALAFSR
ncbi:dihydroneopterin aldolase [uncultured Brevundimonas sp.]|uniref:dihydroneopterin aldolase n=1 Tax=uncultured Brevundimonas sp. TaxID=213418 RepID=UPI0030EF53B0|tara:strand:- start:2640 stop:3038 length:399 start_codon:yes stop_codon:yes gene_type:complete